MRPRFAAITVPAMVVTVACGVLAACDEITATDWSYYVPDTVMLYSLSSAEYFGYPSAFDLINGYNVVVEVEGSSGWDIAVANEQSTFSFLMPGAIHGLSATSSIVAIEDAPFDDVEQAPTEGYDSTGVVIDPSAVYVVRTRSITDYYGNSCRYYAKLETVAVDTALATLSFRYLANPNCNSRNLIPSESS